MQSILRDFRDARRNLSRNIGLTLTSITVLTVAIGGMVGAFSVMEGVLLSELPFEEPEDLVSIGFDSVYTDRLSGFPLATFEEIAAQASESFDGVAAIAAVPAEIQDAGPRRSAGNMEFVTGDYFEILGLRPAIGQLFESNAAMGGGGTPGVVSYGYWQREWGGDPAVLGQVVRVGNRAITIIGVMSDDAPSYQTGGLGAPTAFWIPVDMADPGFRRPSYRVIARLRPGTDIRTAQAHLDTIAGRFDNTESEGRFPVRRMLDDVVGDYRGSVFLFVLATGFLLLIGVLNLANLQASRLSKREDEFAIRAALGATRMALLRSTVVESMLLTGLGAASGFVLAYAIQDAAKRRVPRMLPRWDEIAIDGNAFIFAVGISAVAGITLGVVPAIRASRMNMNSVLTDGAFNIAGGRRERVIRNALLLAQSSLATILLVGAVLLIFSFGRMAWVDFGFDGDGVAAVEIALPRSYSGDAARAFASDLLQEVRRLPQVDDAAVSDTLPGFRSPRARIEADGTSVEILDSVHFQSVSGNYGTVLEISTSSGRWINDNDLRSGRLVVVVSESLANRLWPGRDAVGMRLRWPDGPSGIPFPWMEVVGVVGDVRDVFDNTMTPKVYAPYGAGGAPNVFQGGLHLAVRTTGAAGVRAVEDLISRMEGRAEVSVAPVDVVIGRVFERQQFRAAFLGAFAAVALLLAMVGVYSVVSFSSAERKRELGIRAAVGARGRDLTFHMMREGSIPAIVGLALGLGTAFALSEVVESYLYQVRPTEPWVYFGVFFLGAALIVTASWLPARRASRVDPVSSLRNK